MGNRDERGFTLLELMVTVAVIAIIAGIAVPSFRQMLLNSRLTAAANEITAALQGARMSALRTNARVVLCPSTDGSTCSGGDWSKFVMISKRNGTDTLLRTFSLNATGLTVLGSSSISSNNQVWYQADGFVRMGSSAPPAQIGTIGVCSTGLSGNNARDIQASMGRVAVAQTTRSGCGAPGN